MFTGFCIPGMWVLWAACSDSNTDNFITRLGALTYRQLNTFFLAPFVPQLSLSISWLDRKWVFICSYFYTGYQVSPVVPLARLGRGSLLSGLKAPSTPGASPISVQHPSFPQLPSHAQFSACAQMYSVHVLADDRKKVNSNHPIIMHRK